MKHTIDDNIIDTIKQMVDDNYHTEAMIKIADLLINESAKVDNTDLVEDLILFKTLLKDLANYHYSKGHFPYGNIRNEIYDTMLNRSIKEFGQAFIEELRNI